MPTNIKIPEQSFRFGCGRYLQDNGVISKLADEIKRMHCSHPLILGSKTALSVAKDKIDDSLAKGNIFAQYRIYEGFCQKELCRKISVETNESFDIVIGVGGGNIMDAAKLVAVYTNVPIINIPTSSATCAAVAPLSVCYNSNAQTVGTVHHLQEVNCVLVDMDILCRQPLRLFVAGVYDSLAKQYELHQRMLGLDSQEMDIGLLSSYSMSGFIFDYLNENLEKACQSINKKESSKILSDVVFVTIGVTGIVSGLARGSNQTAIAHKIYEVSRKLFPKEVYSYLHGEMVAIGLIAQIVFNGDSGKDQFIKNLKAFKMPCSLSDLGIDVNDEVINMYYDAICASSAMAGSDDNDKQKLKEALMAIK